MLILRFSLPFSLTEFLPGLEFASQDPSTKITSVTSAKSYGWLLLGKRVGSGHCACGVNTFLTELSSDTKSLF